MLARLASSMLRVARAPCVLRPPTTVRALRTASTPPLASNEALLATGIARRSFSVTRTVLADASTSKAKRTGPAFNFRGSEFSKYHESKSIHVLDSGTLNSWQELPKGGIYRGPDAFKKIWYNHAVVPIFVVVGAAAVLCVWFMFKFFSVNVEVAFSKEMRGKFDHTGLSDHRAEGHTNRLLYPGMRERNKSEVNMFPFSFVPMASIANKHRIDYPTEEE